MTFFFFTFTFSFFLRSCLFRILSSPSLSFPAHNQRNKTKTNKKPQPARTCLPAHRQSRRRAKDQRGVAPLAQRPHLPLLELERRGPQGPAPRGQGEEEGADGWGCGRECRSRQGGGGGGEEEAEAAQRRGQGAAQRREGGERRRRQRRRPGKRRRRRKGRRRLQQTCCCSFRCPACSRDGLRGRVDGGRVVGLKKETREREGERKRNVQQTVRLVRFFFLTQNFVLLFCDVFLSLLHTLIVFF